MAIKYSDVINLLRTDYKGVIKASDPDFAGFCVNSMFAAKREGVTYLHKYINFPTNLYGINRINFNSDNKNWQMLYPFQGTIHFYIVKNSEQKNNYIRFAWNTLLNYFKAEEIPIVDIDKNFSIYMNYFYVKPSNPNFNFWGEDVVFSMSSTKTLPKKNTWNNGNVKFTDLKTNNNGFGKSLFFAAKIPYDILSGWSVGVGFVFKDIHKNMSFFKKYVDMDKPSRINFNAWATPCNPLPEQAWAYDIDRLLKANNFSNHNMNTYEEIRLDNLYVDFK